MLKYWPISAVIVRKKSELKLSLILKEIPSKKIKKVKIEEIAE